MSDTHFGKYTRQGTQQVHNLSLVETVEVHTINLGHPHVCWGVLKVACGRSCLRDRGGGCSVGEGGIVGCRRCRSHCAGGCAGIIDCRWLSRCDYIKVRGFNGKKRAGLSGAAGVGRYGGPTRLSWSVFGLEKCGKLV